MTNMLNSLSDASQTLSQQQLNTKNEIHASIHRHTLFLNIMHFWH